MKLYTMAGTCALSAHISLEWSGLPYQTTILARGDQHKVGYLKINPMGAVPALEIEPGSILTEALAILLYIDASAPEPFGMTKDAKQLALLARALSFLTTEIHCVFGLHFAPHRFHRDAAEHAELKASAYVRLERLFALFDQHFKGPYLFGADKSVADPYVFVVMQWLALTPIDLARFCNLNGFMTHMKADPVVRSVLRTYQ